MKAEKNYQSIVFAFLIFIILGSALVGTSKPPEPIDYQVIHPDCQEYVKDEDGDGLMGFIEDMECWDYPYQDGLGETDSNNAFSTPQNPPYQTYYDLTVDFVRLFVNFECGGVLQNCIGTNFDDEVAFYCFFEQNVMTNDFYSIFDRAFNQIQTIQDDGSLQMLNFCNAFPASTMINELPNMGTQESENLPDNPSGSPNGGMGGK